MGVTYCGQAYNGWQSQSDGRTVQDALEKALGAFATQSIHTICAGRTDAGVHGLMQVVHFDTDIERPPFSWTRGTNAFLPADIAVQWAHPVPRAFHARASALGRRYSYVLLESAIRPSIEAGRAGWVLAGLDQCSMEEAARSLVGTHDFTSFRASACQALSSIKTLRQIRITRRQAGSDAVYWRFDFEADAFLHHMIRNIMGCLIAVGAGKRRPEWMGDVVAARSRDAAAPTFSANGLYFLGPIYDKMWGLPERTPAFDWLSA